MTEIMYDKNSVLIAAVLFVTMAIAIAIGNRGGRHLHNGTDEGIKTQVNALQGSLLGILPLLLGFTFSQSLQRYDLRSAAVVDEVNAIGTTYLRANILPPEIRAQSQALLHDYIKIRVQAASVSLDRDDDRQSMQTIAEGLQGRLWALAMQASDTTDRPATTNLYL